MEAEKDIRNYSTMVKNWGGGHDPRRTMYIGKKMLFDEWCEAFIKLGGSQSTLKELQEKFDIDLELVNVMVEIRKLKGDFTIFHYYIKEDAMVTCQHNVADIFNNITQGTFIRQKNKNIDDKTRIYQYNLSTQLWDNLSVTDLKKVFMEIMNCYMDTITPMMNKMYFTENYQEDDKDKENIYFKRLNAYKKFIRNDATINSILSIFKSIVKVEDTLFDLSPEYDNYISFKNGIYNLDTGHFRRRNVSDRFTKSLDWDYTPEVHSETYNDIHTFFKKIQPDAEQRRFTVSFLKYCLWGGNPQAKFKMNIGYTAANGKTTEMEIHERAFPLYTDKLDRTIFNKTCTKRHKYCNKLVTLPIRLAYINELDDSKLDEDFLKDFADGKNIELEKMYGTMCENSRMQCKLITTSNKDPNLLPDGGVIRRATIQKYESRFVSASDVNEKKHIYLMDPTWVETRFSQDSYKQMYFLYLLAEGHIRPLNVPEANARLVAQTLNENDDFLPKLETHFVVTKDPKDKVSYLDIQKCFENMPVRALNGHLKRLGIEYDKNGSTNSTRKVYRGIRKYSMSEMQEMNSDHSELLIDDDDPE